MGMDTVVNHEREEDGVVSGNLNDDEKGGMES